ncbi:hypothetical protein GC163_19115 [bacterium]|nr:hypothetical protein [bacterium]
MEKPNDDNLQYMLSSPMLPADRADYFLAAFISLPAIGILGLAMFVILQVMVNMPDPRVAMLASCVICWFGGFPLAIVAWYWYRNVYRGQQNHSYLVRIYWKAQLAGYLLTLPVCYVLFIILDVIF